MFSFFSSSAPLDADTRKWIHEGLAWLMSAFPDFSMSERKVYTPTRTDFPLGWDGSKETAITLFKLLAKDLKIPLSQLQIDFFDGHMLLMDQPTNPVFLGQQPGEELPFGLFYQKEAGEPYTIAINEGILRDSQQLVATMVHELAHVKINGELGIKEIDEPLVDLATVFFGYGIFSANTSFRFSKGYDGWQHDGAGYLYQDVWAHALAVFAQIKGEINPKWVEYLGKTLQKDFKRSEDFLTKKAENKALKEP